MVLIKAISISNFEGLYNDPNRTWSFFSQLNIFLDLVVTLPLFSSSDIDQSLSGNYTCLAKNLYGSDSVEYAVVVLPLPEAPVLRATPYKDSILVEWEQPYYSISNRSSSQKISEYTLSFSFCIVSIREVATGIIVTKLGR